MDVAIQKTATKFFIQQEIVNVSVTSNNHVNEIENFISQAGNYLKEFAISPLVKELLKDPNNKDLLNKAQEYTVEYSSLRDDVEGVFIADITSNTLTHTNPKSVGLVTRNTKDKLQEMYDWLADGKMYISGIKVSPASKELALTMYYPFFDDNNKLLGWCGLGVKTSNFSKNLIANNEEKNKVTYEVVDINNSNVVLSNNEKLINKESPYKKEIPEFIKTSKKVESLNDNIIRSYITLNNYNLLLIEEHNTSHIINLVNSLCRAINIINTIVIICIILLSIVLGKKLMKDDNKVQSIALEM